MSSLKGATVFHPTLVGEPKSCMVQKHKSFAPERCLAGFLYTDSQIVLDMKYF